MSVIDRPTYFTQRFFEGVSLASTATLQDWYRTLTFDRVHSTIVTQCAPHAPACPSYATSDRIVCTVPDSPIHVSRGWLGASL